MLIAVHCQTMAKSALFCLSIQVICVIVLTCGKRLQTRDQQQFIDSLLQYEFVVPEMSEPFAVPSINKDSKVKEKRRLSFHFRGQTINILLTLNSNLLSPNFFERYVTERGYEIVKKAPRQCYFHGHVEGRKDTSIAAITSCDGVEGFFTLRDETFSIQPMKSLTGEVFHIVFESNQMNLPKYKCGFSENNLYAGTVLQEKHRVRRDVLSETKYVELVMVNDLSQFKKHGSNTSTRAIAAANCADSTYRAQNIRVVLTMIEIWKDVDQVVNSTDNNIYLNNFIEYKKKVLDKNETTESDHAVLITQKPLGDRHGWAYTGTICSPRSTSLVYDVYSSTNIFGSVVAHELGHSFGFNHIKTACSCGAAKRVKCLMNSEVSYGPLKWSNCTEAKLKSVLQSNYGTCLFNHPKKHYFEAACQNGFIDDGEECDCGTKEECERIGTNCCNYTTCQLHPHSECDRGPCCENCKIKSQGSICREDVGDCDLPEYCDGKSEICAPDAYVHNGRACSVAKNESLCYLGVCHTHNQQCKLYYGEDAYYDEVCYTKLNVLGTQRGFCKLIGDNDFMKCEKKDVLCGKLQCKFSNGIGKPPLPGGSSTFTTFGSHKCFSGILKYPVDPGVGMVETGSMCAENKVCSNNTCMDINDAYEQPGCPNNCSGNGICNNLGHCHCNPGYGCPNCSEKCERGGGGGGSVDSGGNCYCLGPTTATMTTEPGTTKTTEIGKTETTAADKTTRQQTTQVTTEPTRKTSEGENDKSAKSKDVVKIVVPVGLVVLAAIILLLCFLLRQQILKRFRKSAESTRASFQRSKPDDYHVTFSNREVLPKLSTSEGTSNPGNNRLDFTSVTSIPERKIDDDDAPGHASLSL